MARVKQAIPALQGLPEAHTITEVSAALQLISSLLALEPTLKVSLPQEFQGFFVPELGAGHSGVTYVEALRQAELLEADVWNWLLRLPPASEAAPRLIESPLPVALQ